jgi:hypothetical protein
MRERCNKTIEDGGSGEGRKEIKEKPKLTAKMMSSL